MKQTSKITDNDPLLKLRRKTWDFDGQKYRVDVTSHDLADERAGRSRRVLESYNWYSPENFDGFFVHNEEILDLLKVTLTVSDVKKLKDTATAKGLFNAELDEYGMVRTSNAEENPSMHINRWITDSIYNLSLVDDDESKKKIIHILARFYCTSTEQDAFVRVINAPWLFRDSGNAQEGVAHIFRIEEDEGEIIIKRDPGWANNKRLESHGLALRTFCDFLLQKVAGQADEDSDSKICKAIASLAFYFQAIDYPTAPSAGVWEEIPFSGGLSWDTEAIRQGLVSLDKLLFGPGNNIMYREMITASAKDIAANTKNVNGYELFTDRKLLSKLIQAGTEQVRLRVRQRAEAPGMRKHDASLAFLAQSDLDLADIEDPSERSLETVRLYLELLNELEINLVRENGMIRYEPFSIKQDKSFIFFDSYLNLNYWLSFDEEGFFNPERTKLIREFESFDASDQEVLQKRTMLGVPQREAEWFLVTEMSMAYAKQAQRLFEIMGKGSEMQRKQTLDLFDQCKNKACEYLKRGYARITPATRGASKTAVKSNGEDCPLWAVPEAYEWIRIRADVLGREDHDYVERALPGANTPLAWAGASLKNATEKVFSLLLSENSIASL